MFRFLAAMLGVLNKLLGAWMAHHWRQQGRQEAIKQAEKEVEEQISLGEAAVSIPDPVRDERLRNKYDRSRISQ